MEGFTPSEVSYILGKPVEEVQQDIENFAAELANELATDVLIIEDEPLIAMDIEHWIAVKFRKMAASGAHHLPEGTAQPAE